MMQNQFSRGFHNEIFKIIYNTTYFLALASSVAIAEESGAFIGVGLGRGAAEAKAADVQNVEKTSVYEASYEIIAWV